MNRAQSEAAARELTYWLWVLAIYLAVVVAVAEVARWVP